MGVGARSSAHRAFLERPETSCHPLTSSADGKMAVEMATALEVDAAAGGAVPTVGAADAADEDVVTSAVRSSTETLGWAHTSRAVSPEVTATSSASVARNEDGDTLPAAISSSADSSAPSGSVITKYSNWPSAPLIADVESSPNAGRSGCMLSTNARASVL